MNEGSVRTTSPELMEALLRKGSSERRTSETEHRPAYRGVVRGSPLSEAREQEEEHAHVNHVA